MGAFQLCQSEYCGLRRESRTDRRSDAESLARFSDFRRRIRVGAYFRQLRPAEMGLNGLPHKLHCGGGDASSLLSRTTRPSQITTVSQVAPPPTSAIFFQLSEPAADRIEKHEHEKPN